MEIFDRTGSACIKTTPPYVVVTKGEYQKIKNIKQNEKDLSHTRRENSKQYKSNCSAILHTD